jgi:hypothetical protein
MEYLTYLSRTVSTECNSRLSEPESEVSSMIFITDRQLYSLISLSNGNRSRTGNDGTRSEYRSRKRDEISTRRIAG